MEPLVELLRLCDGDHRPTMGLLHRWIMMTIDKVERIPGNHQWLVRIIKRRWTKQLGHKLHQAGMDAKLKCLLLLLNEIY